jgi:hypothetical protein
VAGAKTALADEVPARENGSGKPKTGASERMAGMAGAFRTDGQDLCIHDLPGGKGCYLCDPDHPYRLKTGAKA